MNTHMTTAHQKLRDSIAAQTAAYLKAGKKIHVYGSDVMKREDGKRGKRGEKVQIVFSPNSTQRKG